MGIQGLQSFVKANASLWERRELKDSQLVIDANNLIVSSFRSMCFDKDTVHYREDIHGGDMVAFAAILRNLFQNLAKCNIEPILVNDGVVQVDHGDSDRLFQDAKTKAIERSKAVGLISEHTPGDTQAMATSLQFVFKLVMDELKLKQFRAAYEWDGQAARLANELKCPIVSNNSNYAILPMEGGWILVDDILKEQPRLLADGSATTKYALSCCIFKQPKLFEQIRGLNTKMMPLFGALLRAPYGSPSDFNHLLHFMNKWQYRGPLTAKSISHKKIVNLLSWLARQASFDEAIRLLCARVEPSWPVRQAIISAARDFRINESRDILGELELIYAPADYPAEPSKQPARVIKSLINEGNIPGTMLDIIFQKPYLGLVVIDDLQLVPSGHIRLRCFAVAIALLRPKCQATPPATGGDEPATNGAKEPSQNWKFIVYERAKGSSELVPYEVEALDDLEGFGSLKSIHIGDLIQMDTDKKRRLLLATFRCDEAVFALIGEHAARFFSGSFLVEAQLCFMLIRYCALESKVKPMRAFVEAVLITLLNYSDEPVEHSDNIGKARLAAQAVVSANQQLGSVNGGGESNPKFRRIMHLISQLSIAYWSLGATNSVLRHPMQVPQLQNYFNCPLIYRLTSKLNSRELNFVQTLTDWAVAPSMIEFVDKLAELIIVD